MLAPAFIIADASCINRPGLANLLKEYFTGCTITEVEDAAALMAATQQQWYDAVFTQIHLPADGGFATAQNLLQQCSSYRVIFYAHHNTQQQVVQAFAAGAAAFFNCQETKDAILHKIKEVLHKGCCFTPAEFEAYKTAHSRLIKAQDTHKPLTPREKEVLAFLCKGLINREIADTLFISKKTVDNHRGNIMEKTGCSNIAELIVYAKEREL